MERTPHLRFAAAVAASVLVHAGMLALPPGTGMARWTPGASADSQLVLVLEPAIAQPAVAEPIATAEPIARPAPRVALAKPHAAVRPARDPGPSANAFGFTTFRTGDADAIPRALADLPAGVDPVNVASMSEREVLDTGFKDDSRGAMRALAAVVVAADGSVEDVVVSADDETFAGYVSRRIRAMPFEPARVDGAPVRGLAVVSVDFCPRGSAASCAGDAARAPAPARAASD
jgi:hypothetical protein